MEMITHYERIERLAASGHSPEEIAGCIKRFEFRCGRGRG
jgi:DNA-binding CsgD family transcriptional regulator